MSRVWCLSRFSPLIPVASLFYSSTYSTTRDWFLHLWQEQGMCGRTSVQNPGNVFDQIIMCMPVLTATSIRKNKNAGIPHAVALCRYWFFCFFFPPQIEGSWQPCMEQARRRPFSSSTGLLRVSVSHSGYCHNCWHFCITTVMVVVWDQWSLMLPGQDPALAKRTKLRSSGYQYLQRTKETMLKELKGNTMAPTPQIEWIWSWKVQ